ncbi:hypothetical protein, partial [[Eubacterium] cellulosolvens]
MKRHSGIIAILILLVLLMSVYLNIVTILPKSDASTVTQFTDGTSEFVVEFPNTVTKYLRIPADANVTKVSLNISSMEYGAEFPEDIQVIFGETLPYDWAYRGEGHGAYGQQEYFSKGQRRVNLSYDPDKENDTLFFNLPKNAVVSSGSVKMTGFEWDYWEPWIKELNLPDTRTWNMDPFPYVYNNRLWCFYRSYNSTETSESDADIAYNWTTDGVNWQTFSRELTPSPDTEVPYPDQNSYDHRAGDFHPFVVEFNNNMGVFWGSMSYYAADANESGPLAPGSYRGITQGSDRDIVARWYHNSNNSWGNDYVEITHPTKNADESNYTKNPGGSPLGKDDRRAYAIEFKNKIWVVWVANNTGNTTFHMHDYTDDGDQENPEPWYSWLYRGDIMISNSSDGYVWDKAKNLCQNDTKSDAWYNRDFYPTMYVWKNKLFVMWETNGRQFGTDVENRWDYDIVYRYTEDGVTWSNHTEVTPKNDTPDGETHIEFSYPDEDPRLISFYDPVAEEDRLYCVWRTRNPKITNGTDYDIVIRYTTDGDNWSDIKELTDPATNGNYDNKPELTVFNNKLYVVWRREQGEGHFEEDNPDGDIVSRHWDGVEWSPLQEISPSDGEGTGRDDFYPNSAVFKNQFYTIWCTRNRGTSWTQGTDADVVYRRMSPSDLPLDTGLDIGGDDTWELPINTKLSDSTRFRTVDIKDSLNSLLTNPTYLAENTWLDNYGNEMVEFVVKVYIGQPGRVRMDDLNIEYTCTLESGDHITKSPENGEEPFRRKIMSYIADNQDKIDSNGNIDVPFKVSSQVKGKVRVHDIHLEYNMLPSLTLLTPEAGIQNLVIQKNATAEYTVKWEDEDVDGNAKISLYYYKVTQKKSEAKLIVSGLDENDNMDEYIWKFKKNEVPTGRYFIFGRISDGIDTMEAFAPGTFNVTWEQQYSPWISITQPSLIREAWDFFIIQWNDYDPDDNAKIYLYYTLNFSDYDNATQIDINGDGYINELDFIFEDDDETQGTFDWNITKLVPGSRYYIAAKIDDGFNEPVYNCSLGRVIKKYIPSPQNLTLIGDLNPDSDIAETHNRKPSLGWRMLDFSTSGLDFHITVWEGSSSAGKKVFEIDTGKKTATSSEIKAVINTQLEYDQSYYVEVYAFTDIGARSEPTTLRFSCVNRLPEIISVIIRPPEPTSANAISCEVVVNDLDGDVVELSYKWYKNGEHQEEYDDKINIISADTVKGDVWKVEVLPFDSFGYGTVQSTTVEIGNTIPTCDILEPRVTFELYDQTKTNVKGTYFDADDDEPVMIAWYVDLDDPTNYSALSSHDAIKQGEGASVRDALEFKYKFPSGTHNLTLVVFDSNSLISMKPSYNTIAIEVKKGKPSEGTAQDLSFIIGAVAGVIIIIIILILIMMLMKRRKPVSEREKMYGKDMGLKPGEAYPAEEEKRDSYFGDDLDRKG